MLTPVYIFIIGLVVGSFVGALSYRLPRGISIIKGRSFCPNCRKQVFWYDNIPLLSFLIIGGKCRNCRKSISIRYPLIETLTAFVFLGIYFLLQGVTLMQASLSYWALPYLWIVSLL